MFISTIVITVIANFELTVAQQFSSLSTGGPQSKIRACAKCFYADGRLPFNLQNQLRQLPSDSRCQYWSDEIPESEYEDCGEPLAGESLGCVQLNLTLIMQNAVTDLLNQADQTVSGASGIAGAIGSSNPFASVSDVGNGATNVPSFGNFGFSGGSNPTGFGNNPGGFGNNNGGGGSGTNFGAAFGNNPNVGGPSSGGSGNNNGGGGSGTNFAAAFGNNPNVASPFRGRKKRQVMIGGDNFPGFLSSTNNNRPSLSSPTNPLPVTDALVPNFGQVISPVTDVFNPGTNSRGPDGPATVKMYYKGCVRLSVLETLAGSHCKLQPDLADIRFFSQQALLEPLMNLINNLDSTLGGLTGTKTRVDGLCYVFSREFARVLWNTIMKASPAFAGIASDGSGITDTSASIVSSFLPGLGKK